MRKLWAYKTIDWNNPIPKALQKEWDSFFKEMYMLKHLNFPRSIKSEDAVGYFQMVHIAQYARWKKA